jgi:hypothetical protein
LIEVEEKERSKVVWNRPVPLGKAIGVSTFGTIAAPVLTGFSLTTVVELVGRSATTRGMRGDLAIAAFTGAAGLLVFAIQAALIAASYQVSPADRMAWIPESKLSDKAMNQLRVNQWRDEAIARRHRGIARTTYNLGILSFLLGLVAVLIPEPGRWTWPRIVAIVTAAIAVALETVLVTGWPDVLRRALSPSSEDATREQQRVQELQPPEISKQALRKLLFDEQIDGRPDDAVATIKGVTAQIATLSAQVGHLQALLAKRPGDQDNQRTPPNWQ